MVKVFWLTVRIILIAILLVACRSETRVQPTPVLKVVPGNTTPNGSPTPLSTVSPNTVPTPTAVADTSAPQVEYNEAVRGVIDGTTREGVWHFTGTTDEVVYISVDTVNGALNPTLSLYSRTNTLIARALSTDPFHAELTATLPANGSYRVVVTSEDNSTGVYEMVVTTVQTEGRLVYGDRVVGLLTADQSESNWTFDAVAGDVVDIVVRANGELDTRLDLYDANENVVVSDDDTDGLNPVLRGYPILRSGSYTIRISLIGQVQAGGYELELRKAEAVGGVIGLNSTAAGNFDDRFHLWRFEGIAGTEISVQVEAASGSIFDPFVEVYSPDGRLLASDDDSGEGTNAFIRQVVLPETGTYFILISALSGNGAFTLTLGPAQPPVKMGTVRYDQMVTGTLADGAEHAWTLEVQPGDAVTIAVNRATNATNLDVKVALTDEEGTFLASDDDGGDDTNALIAEHPLLSQGSYTILVSAFSGEGAYTLAVSRVAPTPMTVGDAVIGEVAQEGAVIWWFDGVAGERVDINAISMEPEGNLDLTLSLYTPEGRLLEYDDDSGDGLNALIERWTVPESQRYLIVARALTGEGPFTMSLRRVP